MPIKKLSYRVREGVSFGSYFEYGPGSIIELTEADASGFLDKLELVNKPDVVDPDAELNHLKSLTKAQLVKLDEFEKVPAPKPTSKSDIITAILAVRYGAAES